MFFIEIGHGPGRPVQLVRYHGYDLVLIFFVHMDQSQLDLIYAGFFFVYSTRRFFMCYEYSYITTTYFYDTALQH